LQQLDHNWNINVPASLQDQEISCTELKKQLKTTLVSIGLRRIVTSDHLHLINTLTYLLTDFSVI